MPIKLTVEQVIDLSPDDSSMKSAKKLALSTKWLSLGNNDNAVWGTIKGSGKSPYEVAIDLTNGPAYKCNCSSRKIPCKHSLALMLVFTQESGSIPNSPPPDWVQEWLDKRAAKLANGAQPKEVDRESQAKRAEKRQSNILAGLDEIDIWMRDLVRAGLASVQGKPRSFYEAPAKRLIDAQAPALAERVRSLADMPGSHSDWVETMLRELASLYFIIEGFRRYDSLPAPMQADLRTVVGWSLLLNELADEPTVHDTWFVMGRYLSNSKDRLRTQRLWLYGMESGQVALLLEFSHGGKPFETNLTVGEAIDAEMVFYPSGYPLRAVIRSQHGAKEAPAQLPGYLTLKESIDAYAEAMAKNPWVMQFPVAYRGVIPVKDKGGWLVVDEDKNYLPITSSFRSHWEMFALSGGRPIWFFGEWNGETLYPLTIAEEGRVVTFG